MSKTLTGPAAQFPPAPVTGAATPPPNCELVVPIRADTGEGGTAGEPSGGRFLLAAGGLLALGAAFGVHRSSRGRRS